MYKEKPLIKVNYGIASSYDDGIEINKKLDGELRDKVIKHERMHRNSHYNTKDFKNDFDSKNPYMKETILFAVKNPEAWVGFMPFMWSYYYKIMTFNWSATIPFLYFGLIFSGFWWLLFKTNVLYSFICYLAVVLVLNIILMGITHLYIRKIGVNY